MQETVSPPEFVQTANSIGDALRAKKPIFPCTFKNFDPMSVDLPPGTIVLATGEHPRYNTFFAALIRTLAVLPEGSSLAWSQGVDLCFNWNTSISRSVGEWIWMVGDDHNWDPWIIHRLWSRQKECVVPFVLKRGHPHDPVIYSMDMNLIKPKNGQQGMQQVGHAGGAGMLVKRSVLELMPRPWFSFLEGNDQRAGEDLAFCRKLHAMGVPIYVDYATLMGHLTTIEVWPMMNPDGTWVVEYRNNLNVVVL